MGRVYTVEFENVTVSLDQDLFFVEPAANHPFKVLGWTLAVVSNADTGDAEEEYLRLKLIRGHATAGSGGSTPTAIPYIPGDTAASFATVHANDTTIASTGTAVDLWSGGFNIRAGHEVFLPEEYRPQCTATEESIVLRLMADTTDAISLSGTLWLLEEG